MIFLIFMVGVLFAGIALLLGLTQGSFGFAYLGMFAFLLLGLFIMSEGIAIDDGIEEDPFGSHTFITVYETHTTANDPIVNIIANTFFYIPLAGVLLTTFIALRNR